MRQLSSMVDSVAVFVSAEMIRAGLISHIILEKRVGLEARHVVDLSFYDVVDWGECVRTASTRCI